MRTVRVANMPVSSNAPLFIGMERGFFREAGLRIEPVEMTALRIPFAVASHQVSFGYTSVCTALSSRSNSIPLQIVAPAGTWAPDPARSPFAVVVRRGSPIRSPSDLEWHSVAVDTLIALPHVSFIVSARSLGADPQKIRFVETPFESMSWSLANGVVDAADLGEPFLTQERDAGGVSIVANSAGFSTGTIHGVWMTSDRLAHDDPALVRDFRAAMQRATAEAEMSPEAARRVLPQYARTPASLAQRVSLPLYTNRLDASGVTPYLEAMSSLGLVRPDLDLSALLPAEAVVAA